MSFRPDPSLKDRPVANEQPKAAPRSSSFRPDPSLQDRVKKTAEPQKGGGIFSFLGNVGKGIGERGVGFAKEIMSLPQKAAAFGADLGTRAAAAVRPDATYEQLKAAREGGGVQKAATIAEAFKPQNEAEEQGALAADIATAFATPMRAGAALATKLPQSFKWLGTALGMGAEGAAIAGVQTGDSESAGTAGAITAGLPVIGKIGKIAGEGAKFISSKLSGVPTRVLEKAFRDPTTVQEAMRHAAKIGDDQALQQTYDRVLETLNDLRQAKGDAYAETLEEIQKTSGGKLSLSGVQDAAEKVLKKFNVERLDDDALDFASSRLEPMQKDISFVLDKISSWTDKTPIGINRLRQIVDDQRITQPNKIFEKQYNSFLTDVKKNITSYLESADPRIGQMNKEFAAATETLENMIKELGTKADMKEGSAALSSTGLRRLTNIFNPKSSVYRPIYEQLNEKAGRDLMADVAGALMARNTAEGLGGYISTALAGGAATALNVSSIPVLIAGLLMSSPRLIGEAITTAGKASKALPDGVIEKSIRNIPAAIQNDQ